MIYRPSMDDDGDQAASPSARRSPLVAVSTVIGVGTAVSLLGGLLYGLIIGDLPVGLADVLLWGMILTAVVGVLVAVAGDKTNRLR